MDDSKPRQIETGRRVVYPWYCDVMGHLATQHYMAFLDDAFLHFMAELAPAPQPERLGWADVRHEIDYLAELRAGDLVVLRSSLLAIGRKSIRHQTEIRRQGCGTVCARVISTTVRFDLDARRAIDVEPGIAARAQALDLLPRAASKPSCP
ncbi:acyl-CoA thioesterase [Paracoccus kondratievae]|uniref:acyl-CoA thioesterase n=1 Tax=Paracoccus kondratievae TaxID=135740 RepID=UPI0012662944|nr:acyl-CoA thioesterase [Paracoccus kondratievae]QFQ89105.1 acyl-CoA thioesterase [Paracoccus kondratievae]